MILISFYCVSFIIKFKECMTTDYDEYSFHRKIRVASKIDDDLFHIKFKMYDDHSPSSAHVTDSKSRRKYSEKH
jgi:hypothetical protein